MIKMNEPKVLTRMRLSCCWGDRLDEKELNEVVDYIDWLQNNWNELKKWLQIRNKCFCEEEILEKMQELENSNNENTEN